MTERLTWDQMDFSGMSDEELYDLAIEEWSTDSEAQDTLSQIMAELDKRVMAQGEGEIGADDRLFRPNERLFRSESSPERELSPEERKYRELFW